MAQSFVNLMILIDDANGDETVAIAKAMKPGQGFTFASGI